jgi:hypothetical protein
MTNEGTLRYYGQASVMLDKPTKAKLKADAEAANMELWQYVRFLADKANSNKQSTLPGVSTATLPGIASMLQSVTVKADEILASIGYARRSPAELRAIPAEIRAAIDILIGAKDESLLDEALDAIKAVKVRHEAKLSGQLSLEGGMST